MNQRKALFYLKVLLGNNFPQFDKSPGKYSSKTCQVETKLVCKQTFFYEDISQYKDFGNSNDYQSKHDEIRFNQRNPNTGDRGCCL